MWVWSREVLVNNMKNKETYRSYCSEAVSWVYSEMYVKKENRRCYSQVGTHLSTCTSHPGLPFQFFVVRVIEKNTNWNDGIMIKKKKKAYKTCYSQAVTHPSTTQAQHCLTSVIRGELVYSVWYGSRQLLYNLHLFCLYSATLLRFSSGGDVGGTLWLTRSASMAR